MRILRNLPDQQRLADIFQRSVDSVNEQLYCDRLIGTGQHQTCAWFCEKIIRRLAKPLLIEARSARGSLYISDDCTEPGIVCAAENSLRERVRERGDLAGGTTESVVRHCTSEREAILNHIQPVHAVFRRIHSSPRRECAHRFEITLPAIEKIAVQSKNYIRAIQFGNQPHARSERVLHSSCLLLAQERFVNAPAHTRKSFFQFSAQSFACRRMRFANQEGKTISVLISNGVAERSNVGVKLGAIARFAFANETLRARRIV